MTSALSPWLVLALVAAVGCGSSRESRPDERAPRAVVDVPVGPLAGMAEADSGEPPNPYADYTEAVAEGRRFFVQYNCAGCHGDHGGGGMGPSLRDERWLYGSSHARIAKSIVDGRAHGMPAWGRMLTETQVWQLTAYIKSMRTPREEEPPVGQ